MAKLSLSSTSSANTRSVGKLSLNKETLTALNPDALGQAQGGTAKVTPTTTVSVVLTPATPATPPIAIGTVIIATTIIVWELTGDNKPDHSEKYCLSKQIACDSKAECPDYRY